MIWGWKAAVEITEPIPNPVKSKHGVSATFEQTARGFHFPHSGKKNFPAFLFVPIMRTMERKALLKNEDNWSRNYRDRKLDHHSILEFLSPTFYTF